MPSTRAVDSPSRAAVLLTPHRRVLPTPLRLVLSRPVRSCASHVAKSLPPSVLRAFAIVKATDDPVATSPATSAEHVFATGLVKETPAWA